METDGDGINRVIGADQLPIFSFPRSVAGEACNPIHYIKDILGETRGDEQIMQIAEGPFQLLLCRPTRGVKYSYNCLIFQLLRLLGYLFLLTSAIFGVSALWQKEDANQVGVCWSSLNGGMTKNANEACKPHFMQK